MTRDLLLSRKPKIETIQVPEMGTIHVRVMTAIDRDAYEAEQLERSKSGKELENFRCRLLVRTLCDQEGNRLLTDADAEELGKQDATVIRQLFDAASRLNGLGDSEPAKKN